MTHKIGDILSLGRVNNVAKSENVLVRSGTIVSALGFDKEPKRGSNKLVRSGDIYKAMKNFVVGSGAQAGGGGTSVPAWQNVMTAGNYTNKILEIRSSGETYTSEIYTDETDGNLKLDVDVNKRVESNGDMVAYGDGSSPGGSWWDDLPIATASVLGGVKIGSGITVQPDGTISVSTGVSTWDALTDTPATKVANKWIKVNAGAMGRINGYSSNKGCKQMDQGKRRSICIGVC
jgi:hypothetical protein